MNQYVNFSAIHWNETDDQALSFNLVNEEPLLIRINGNPYTISMRTPGDEMAHVAGFCLNEGVVNDPDEIESISFYEDDNPNAVNVTLKAARQNQLPEQLERRNYIRQTGPIPSGEKMVKELVKLLRPMTDDFSIPVQQAQQLIEKLNRHQQLRQITRSTHAAAIYALDFQLICIAEDLGRHNALDKVIGRLFLDRTLDTGKILVMSSRISYELVQKAARARIPVMLSVSRPTALAIALGSALNMTIACLSKEQGCYIFCGEDRLKR